MRHREQGGWRLAAVPLLLFAALFAWREWPAEWGGARRAEWRAEAAPATPASRATQGKPAWLDAKGPAPDLPDPAGPPGALDDPRRQHAHWANRLKRAEDVLENYRRVTRYPHESRPAAEHGDQMYPNLPVVEDKRLHRPGEELRQNIRLRTSQERVFVAGRETVLFTLSAHDADGNPVPLSVSGAGIADPVQGSAGGRLPRMAAAFNDAGGAGDAAAGDGTWSFRFAPAQSPFAFHTGQLRLDMTLEAAGQSGYTYFDIYYTPEPPAVWTGAIREAVEEGSLQLYLKVEVRVPGRYVAAGRLDDATGKPFALAVFNDELAAGMQEIRLTAFGKLVLDHAPVMPLRLRDVDGFLLREDQSPDRALMPRLPGLVHLTRRHPASAFSPAEWSSEERERYLREYQNDVDLARARLAELARLLPPGG